MTDDPKLRSPCRVKLERTVLHTPAKQLALSAELRNVINERNILTINSRKKMLFELDQHVAKVKEDKKLNTLQEILTSELAYISQIEIIQDFFMKPIRHQQLLKSNEFETLFSNINSIYKVNGALLEELKKDLMYLTGAFHKMAPFLKLYSEYAFNFKHSMVTLDELMHKNKAFSKFIQGQETRPEVQTKLSSLLIAPIQRVPRYCLLIKQVLDNTSHKDNDYKILEETYEKLNDVAKHIDATVQERQNTEALLSLASKVKDGNTLIIKPGRRLIMQGVMNVYSPKKETTKIYMILFSDIIMFCNIKKEIIDQPNSLKCMSIFPLSKCIISQNVNMMLVIRCEEESMTLYCDSDITEWFTILKQTLRGLHKDRSTLRKGSSSRRPAVRFHFEAYKDYGVSPSLKGMRKRRRFVDIDDEADAGPQEQPVKRTKTVECRKSIRTMIPKLVLNPKTILCGKKSKSLNTENSPITTETTSESIEENDNKDQSAKKDTLFPLREHFLDKEREREDQVESSNTVSNTSVEAYPTNVFVFGRNTNRASTFSLGGMLTGLSNSIKRVMGFR